MRYLKKCKEVIYYVLLIILVLTIIINLSSRIPQLYNLTKVSSYTVLTGSMEPVISPGDMVIVRKVSLDKLKVGDIVTFTKDNHSITHRIISINSDEFTTKGDSNDTKDLEKVTNVELTGKVVMIIPRVGYLFNILYTPLMASIFMILGGILIGFKIFKSRELVKDKN
ncbi:signal peptidase I [Clostridium sp.]|uniref:signal peptidase I n=1 Tax=Clostridium sp. TaxID=1506 RepID=UPI0032165D01